MKDASILLVDDDRHVLDSMSNWLRSLGYHLDPVASFHDAVEHLQRNRYDLVLSDIRLDDADGFALLKFCCDQFPQTSVILMTGYATMDTGVEALRAGAFDLLTKPLIDQELEMSISRALSQREVLAENKQLKAQLDTRVGLDNIVGHDPRMQHVFDVIENVAETRATVLITGESGTGKSMIARAIHRRSDRRECPDSSRRWILCLAPTATCGMSCYRACRCSGRAWVLGPKRCIRETGSRRRRPTTSRRASSSTPSGRDTRVMICATRPCSKIEAARS